MSDTRTTLLGSREGAGVVASPGVLASPLAISELEDQADVVAEGTRDAVPNTLALRDAAASFAVKELDYDEGPAPSAATATTVRTYYDQATRLFGIETVAGKFVVSGSAASEGANRLDIGGDHTVVDEMSIWASVRALDGPRLSMGYTSGNVALFCDEFSLNDVTGANSVGFSIPGADTVRVTVAGSTFTLETVGADISIEGDEGVAIVGPTGAAGALGAIAALFAGAGGARRFGFVYGTNTTLDAGTSTIVSIPIPDDTAVHFFVFLVGYRGTVPAAVTFERVGLARAAAGAATLVSFQVFANMADAALGGTSCAAAAAGANINITATGAAAVGTVRWEAYVFTFRAIA